MAELLKIIPTVGPAFVMLFLVACRTADSPTTLAREAIAQPAATPAREAGGPPATTQTQKTGELPAWIVKPPTLPPGRVGKNNCTFEFGADKPKWDFPHEAGCWERSGPDVCTRQQFQKIHHPKFPRCDGAPGDGTAIRVCRAGGAGQASPCGGKTGPKGCARCVGNPTCH